MSDLEKYASDFQKAIKNAVSIANDLRPHILGGATLKEMAVRTAWDVKQCEECLKFLKTFKILTVKQDKKIFGVVETKYFIDFEPQNIMEKIQREATFHSQRLYELDLLQQHFVPIAPAVDETAASEQPRPGPSLIKDDTE